jgi:hypothetical protein
MIVDFAADMMTVTRYESHEAQRQQHLVSQDWPRRCYIRLECTLTDRPVR